MGQQVTRSGARKATVKVFLKPTLERRIETVIADTIKRKTEDGHVVALEGE